MARKLTKHSLHFRCFLALPYSPEFEEVRRVVKEAALATEFEPVTHSDNLASITTDAQLLLAELARADCIVADVSTQNPNVYFEIGQAVAMSKGIFLLAREPDKQGLPFNIQNLNIITYQMTENGMLQLGSRLKRDLIQFRHGARRGRNFSPNRASMPFFVDWDRLEYQDVENLCRELLLQMGYRHVEWHKATPEFDIIADLPRKDPDGFEYRELWLVSFGRNVPIEMLLDMAIDDPDIFLHRLLRDKDKLIDERRMLDRGGEVSLAILLVLLDRPSSAEDSRMLSERIRRKERNYRCPFHLRIRVWDRDYVTSLIQQFPQLGYKYFSDEARSLAKYRKGPEELYQENIHL